MKEHYLATCIGAGLTELRQASFSSKWNYYQAFFLLSVGIERLLKIIIILKLRIENNKFPSNKALREFGHDIKDMIKYIGNNANEKNNQEKITDEIQIKIIDFLTKFAKRSRYYNIDSLSEETNQIDPLVEWKGIQNKIKLAEGLQSNPIPRELSALINSLVLFAQHNEEGKLISDADSFFADNDILDLIQGYSCYHIWKIVQVHVDILRYYEYTYSSPISLREFFPFFIRGWDHQEDINILKWKDWNYLK